MAQDLFVYSLAHLETSFLHIAVGGVGGGGGGGGTVGGIVNLFICTKKNYVMFCDAECLPSSFSR